MAEMVRSTVRELYLAGRGLAGLGSGKVASFLPLNGLKSDGSLLRQCC